MLELYNVLYTGVGLQGAEWRAIIQPAGREQSALSDPATPQPPQPGQTQHPAGGGCTAFNSLFTNTLFDFDKYILEL